MGSEMGQDDPGHCAYLLVSLNGNLEHFIPWFMLPSRFCVSKWSDKVTRWQQCCPGSSVWARERAIEKDGEKNMRNIVTIWITLRVFSRSLAFFVLFRWVKAVGNKKNVSPAIFQGQTFSLRPFHYLVMTELLFVVSKCLARSQAILLDVVGFVSTWSIWFLIFFNQLPKLISCRC